VKDADHDDNMVERLLEFKALADQVVSSCFLCEKNVVVKSTSDVLNSKSKPSTSQILAKQPDQDFIYALTDSFEMAFKARRSKPAEMIAKYIDRAMRKGQGKASDTEFQDILDKPLALYRFTDDKDVFRTFYHRSLAKRLLLDKSASDDFERAILKKMKERKYLEHFLYDWMAFDF
jgi:cullin-4